MTILAPWQQIRTKTFDDTKWLFPPSSNVKAVLPDEARNNVRTILNCPRKVTNATYRWNLKGKTKTEPSGLRSGTKRIKERMQCSARRLGNLHPLSNSSCYFSHQDLHILTTNSMPQAALHNRFKTMVTTHDVSLCPDPDSPQINNIDWYRIDVRHGSYTKT